MLNFLLRTSPNLDLFKLIYNEDPAVFEYINDNGLLINIHRLFEESLKRDSPNVARTLWRIGNDSIDLPGLFVDCCVYGKLEQAKLLWELSEESIDITADDNEPFLWACYEGHFELAQWLWSICDMKELDYKHIFEECLLSGCKDLARWIAEKSNGIVNLDEYRNKEICYSYIQTEGTPINCDFSGSIRVDF